MRKAYREMDKNWSRHFTREDIRMAKKNMKRYSPLSFTRKIKVKARMIYCYIHPSGQNEKKKKDNANYWGGCETTRTLINC